MRTRQPDPAGRTNRGGWNSIDKTVLDQDPFQLLRGLVLEAIDVALTEMGKRGLPFELESWVNLHDKAGFNFLHVHEGSFPSSSFYLRVPARSGNLIFRDPRPGVLHGFLKGSVANGYSDIRLRPEEGLLVLFPPWLEHFVEPHESDDPRIVIAFNAIPLS